MSAKLGEIRSKLDKVALGDVYEKSFQVLLFVYSCNIFNNHLC